MKIDENQISNTIGCSMLVWSELLMNSPDVSEYNASTLFKVSIFFKTELFFTYFPKICSFWLKLVFLCW